MADTEPGQHGQPQDERAALQAAVSHAGAEANLLLCWRGSSGSYRVRRVQMEEDLAGHFLELAGNAAEDLLQRTHIPYDPEWPLKEHEYFAIPNDPPVGGDLGGQLGDYTNLGFFNRRDLTKPRLYIVAVSNPEGIAYFGKRMGQSLSVLNRRKRGVVRVVYDGSTFSELQDSVATFSTTFDWVVWKGAKGTMYVLNAAEFHREFRDVPALLKSVEEDVSAIRAKIEIEGYQTLIERCQSNVALASKLNHVVEHGITDEPVEELKKYAEEYDLAVAWNGDALVFEDSVAGWWAILKLLDEDRTEGPVSGRHYESAAKREV